MPEQAPQRPLPIITTLPDGKLCDFIDGAIRNDTPEEYVRQNIERRLVKELGYLPERIAVEFTIKVGSAKKRVDIAIFPDGARHLQENIDIIIECKHEKVKPSDKKDVVRVNFSPTYRPVPMRNGVCGPMAGINPCSVVWKPKAACCGRSPTTYPRTMAT